MAHHLGELCSERMKYEPGSLSGVVLVGVAWRGVGQHVGTWGPSFGYSAVSIERASQGDWRILT